MKALAWISALLIIAMLGLLAFRTFAVPLIREEARRSLRDKETVTTTHNHGTMASEALSKECDAAMPESSKRFDPFFSAFQRDGTYSVFLVEVPRKLIWRYDCRRIGGVATMTEPVIQPSTAPAQ